MINDFLRDSCSIKNTSVINDLLWSFCCRMYLVALRSTSLITYVSIPPLLIGTCSFQILSTKEKKKKGGLHGLMLHGVLNVLTTFLLLSFALTGDQLYKIFQTLTSCEIWRYISSASAAPYKTSHSQWQTGQNLVCKEHWDFFDGKKNSNICDCLKSFFRRRRKYFG